MWHYQILRRKSFDGHYYGIYEYYPDLGQWTEEPIGVEGDSIEDLNRQLDAMKEDIKKYGVMDLVEVKD